MPAGDGRAGAMASVLGAWASHRRRTRPNSYRKLSGSEQETRHEGSYLQQVAADAAYTGSGFQNFSEGDVSRAAGETS